MMVYPNGNEIKVGDSVLFENGRTTGIVVDVVNSDQITDYNVDEAGVMLKSAPCGLVFIPVSTFGDQELALVRRADNQLV